MTAETSGNIQIVVSVISGLFGGALGGVTTAGVIARRGERARTRYAATTAIRGALNSYRAQLVHDRGQLQILSHFTESFASIWGQEELAKSIVTQLPLLSRRRRRRIRRLLCLLVGELPLEFAERRAHVPTDSLDIEQEKQRQTVQLLKAIQAGQSDRTGGLLNQLLKTESDIAANNVVFEQVLADIDKLGHLVRP